MILLYLTTYVREFLMSLLIVTDRAALKCMSEVFPMSFMCLIEHAQKEYQEPF